MHNGGPSGYLFSNRMYEPPKVVTNKKGQKVLKYTREANILNHWNNVARHLINTTPKPGVGKLDISHPVIESQMNQATRNWTKDNKGNWVFNPVK